MLCVRFKGRSLALKQKVSFRSNLSLNKSSLILLLQQIYNSQPPKESLWGRQPGAPLRLDPVSTTKAIKKRQRCLYILTFVAVLWFSYNQRNPGPNLSLAWNWLNLGIRSLSALPASQSCCDDKIEEGVNRKCHSKFFGGKLGLQSTKETKLWF